MIATVSDQLDQGGGKQHLPNLLAQTTRAPLSGWGAVVRAWNGLGGRIIAAIQDRAERKHLAAPGPIGDFYRAGGNSLLYQNLPLGQDDLHSLLDVPYFSFICLCLSMFVSFYV